MTTTFLRIVFFKPNERFEGLCKRVRYNQADAYWKERVKLVENIFEQDFITASHKELEVVTKNIEIDLKNKMYQAGNTVFENFSLRFLRGIENLTSIEAGISKPELVELVRYLSGAKMLTFSPYEVKIHVPTYDEDGNIVPKGSFMHWGLSTRNSVGEMMLLNLSSQGLAKLSGWQ